MPLWDPTVSRDSDDKSQLRDCLGTLFRNSLKIGRLDKINPLF
ncbi:MAG: hypothetical protein [Olavius algarvensis Gamma 1 endosymbiont]|nr:MAG: hypothetical protein [Olavius algarvensis Gamma 1 endosymbiont]